jgi:predicted SprT family Zn-dependent metalloprotease
MTPAEQVRSKCKEIIEKAKTLYGVDISQTSIQFNLKGRVAGWAEYKGSIFGEKKLTVRFNYDMLMRNDPEVLRNMLEDTVPHELAHLVCFLKPSLGKNHDAGWQRVCIALGGTGGRTHDNEVVYGKGTTYEYTTDRGHKVRLNERRHQYIRSGGTLIYRKGMGSVTMSCAYSIVGANGRTLSQPIVKQPAAQPDAAEMARRQAMVDELRRRELATKAVPVQTLCPELALLLPPVAPRILPPAPPVQRPAPVHVTAAPGESKAATSRRIMLSGYRAGHSYETIIAAMQLANGYDRQLARGTFRANAPKIGIPASFYQ